MISTAQLVRDAIGKQVAKQTACTDTQVARFLGMPKTGRKAQFTLPLPRMKPFLQPNQDLSLLASAKPWVESVLQQGAFLQFNVALPLYIRHTLQQVHSEQARYGTRARNGSTVVVDYSSPNIAKPFHAGHLRSTIIGHFIASSHAAMGYDVVGINYLGDWGKQYGLLAVGYDRTGDAAELARDPIQHLYNVYVDVNRAAEHDATIDEAAKRHFRRMEQGDAAVLAQWQQFRDLSIESYKTVYQRLGIQFDVFGGESQAEPFLNDVYSQLDAKSLLDKQDDGRYIVDLDKHMPNSGLGQAVLRRQDGTSLYLTRDLATLILRTKKYNVDKAIYTIGAEQSLHMQQLFAIWRLMTGNSNLDLHHASFGRVHGMSTRKGNVVFLQQILDQAKSAMRVNMEQDTRKYDELRAEGIAVPCNGSRLFGDAAVDYVADKLGASAVIIQDLAAKRVKNYDFAWDRMLQARGYTGVFLQFTHARLCGIERHAGIPVEPIDDISSLVASDAAIDLALTISQYPDILQQACDAMEPSTLVQYLFRLAHSVGQAATSLHVKNEPDLAVAKARLLLFASARTTLANGLGLLGIKPLERI
ncbi:hypothetical protein BC940DRAFT_264248 [Gongronella butleri]|nr:hypothetical protein BC940DRAFT_264248 [Gongronella butleri]